MKLFHMELFHIIFLYQRRKDPLWAPLLLEASRFVLCHFPHHKMEPADADVSRCEWLNHGRRPITVRHVSVRSFSYSIWKAAFLFHDRCKGELSFFITYCAHLLHRITELIKQAPQTLTCRGVVGSGHRWSHS